MHFAQEQISEIIEEIIENEDRLNNCSSITV